MKVIDQYTKGALLYTVTELSLALGVTGPTPASQKEAEQTKAQKLWEAAVAAKGGRERLRTVRDLYVESSYRGSADRSYDLYVFPDRRFYYTYWAAYERTDVNVYNGTRGISWWQEGKDPAQVQRDVADAAEYVTEAQFTFLLLTRWLEPNPLRARKDWNGLKRVDVIETDVEGWRVDYYLDPKTSLPIKLVYGYSKIERAKGEMNRAVQLEDYRSVSGIMMPHRLLYSFINGPPAKSDQHPTYELNADFDEQIFEKPPTPRIKPEAWRRLAKQ